MLTADDDDYDDDYNGNYGGAAGKGAATGNKNTTRAQQRQGTNGDREQAEMEPVETEPTLSSDPAGASGKGHLLRDTIEEDADGSGGCGEIERSSGAGRASRRGSSKSSSTVVPGEGALREQRRQREERERERAINAALEKVRLRYVSHQENKNVVIENLMGSERRGRSDAP